MKTDRLRSLASLSLFALIGFSFGGCGPGGTAVERGDRAQILHAALGAPPESLDPHIITSVAGFDVMRAIQEGLISEDPRDLSPTPGVAERWEVSSDQLEYTFFLRPDARWSNGDRVTAQDFIFSFQRVLSPALGAQYAYMLFLVENAEAYHAGTLGDFAQVGFEVLDDLTLQIRLNSPTPYFLSILTNPAWWPVHPPTVLSHGRIDQRASGWTRPGNFVGNGPFILSQWRTGREIVTIRNPYYWDADAVCLREIHFHPIESSDTQERAFRSGQLHFTKSIQPNRVSYYEENQPAVIRSEPYLGVYFFRLNTGRPPFDDPRVRQAFSLAIDKESIVRNVMHGRADPAGSFTPPDTGDFSFSGQVSFDPERARQLLAEAGYPGGENFPAVDLLFNTQELHRQIAEAVQQMLRTELNIQINLFNQEWQAYLASVRSGNYQMARAAWIGDYLDPNTFLDMWLTDGGNNSTGWSKAAYDALIQEAGRTADPAQRQHIFQQAETILLDELPIIPIYHYRNNYLIQPSVRGWFPNVLDRHPYKFLYLEPETK